ncbi:MAG: hypothetical protein JXA81_09695 [Sedimentisphaerales bacterium]|nr:hypothetical protein [Sedimentisphaerales bacterium]
MNKAQKTAWFSLIMVTLGFGLSLIAVGVLYFCFGLPMRRAAGGFGFIGIMGLSALAPLLFKKDKNKVKLDERDLLIRNKATMAAYCGFWPVFVIAAMAPFFIYGPDGTVSVKYLCGMVFGGMFIVILVQSLVTLQEYDWKDKGEQS